MKDARSYFVNSLKVDTYRASVFLSKKCKVSAFGGKVRVMMPDSDSRFADAAEQLRCYASDDPSRGQYASSPARAT